MVTVQNAPAVVTLTFMMTENFPIPLRMLYQIPADRTEKRPKAAERSC